MPKSKRDRKVALSKVTKKVGLNFKQELIDKIREAVDKYDRLFVFTVDNMRNQKLKALRDHWRESSKFFLGKNRVMSVALGRTDAEEYADKLHLVSKILHNQCGLLFTNESQDKVQEFFASHSEPDFARTGAIAEDDVTLHEGPLSQFGHAMEPQLRGMGMPTALKKGVIHLIKDFVVCSKGDKLTSEQARILKLLGHQHAQFRINLLAIWTKDGEFEVLKEEIVNAHSRKQSSPKKKQLKSKTEEMESDDEEEDDGDEDGDEEMSD